MAVASEAAAAAAVEQTIVEAMMEAVAAGERLSGLGPEHDGGLAVGDLARDHEDADISFFAYVDGHDPSPCDPIEDITRGRVRSPARGARGP